MRDRDKYNSYMASYMKDRYNSRRAAALVALGGYCVMCGSANQLEFDHIDSSTKVIEVSKIWYASEERFQLELLKCQLLCRSCHTLKTIDERGFKVAKGTHGTLSAIKYCKPRCDLCKAAMNDYMRKRSARRKHDR